VFWRTLIRRETDHFSVTHGGTPFLWSVGSPSCSSKEWLLFDCYFSWSDR